MSMQRRRFGTDQKPDGSCPNDSTDTITPIGVIETGASVRREG
jgi:hypothetical protein